MGATLIKSAHSRLARSVDYMRTWDWSNRSFEEFGHIALINYGNNYEGAKDGYVYKISHDNPSIYKQADQFIMIRVPKEQLMGRDSYKFFSEIKDSQPCWSAVI